jgi:hypothetical protein
LVEVAAEVVVEQWLEAQAHRITELLEERVELAEETVELEEMPIILDLTQRQVKLTVE